MYNLFISPFDFSKYFTCGLCSYRFSENQFSISHVFKAKTSSSRRTQYCASLLNKELRHIHFTYMSVWLLKMKLENKHVTKSSLIEIIKLKFNLDENSLRFFLLNNLSSSDNDGTSLSALYPHKSIVISGKSSYHHESDFLKSQLVDSYITLSILNSKSPMFQVINSKNGGTYYLGSKLMFILIPRSESVLFPCPHLFHSALAAMESSKPQLSSNRGNSRKVLFESCKSNYVDVGVGVARSGTGLYMKSIKNISKTHVQNFDSCLCFLNKTIAKYLPSSLMEVFSNGLKFINMDDFKSLKSYHKPRKDNIYTPSKEDTNIKVSCDSNFLPSASYGKNNLLPLHTDNDMFLSVVHIHSDRDIVRCESLQYKSYYKVDSDIVKYFTFDNSTSVALRSGDLLIFNPTIPHCISSCTDDYENASTYCLSHYFKTSIVGRNNNSIEFHID